MSAFDEQPDGDPHGECAAEIHRLQEINAQLLDVAKHLVRWHDQLTPSDIARAKAVIEKASGGAS